MCLIMTIIAAIGFTAAWIILSKNDKNVKSIFTTMLAFWGAALMWCIDGVANVIGGEAFFDISMEDTVLGLIILGCGLMLFGILTLKDRISNRAVHN
ncbi:MAG: hypothetical protein IKN25_06195 [Spirochaetales bacterium]|nr:hypothetical protein [Spirochaetales bacterium]